jgi:hypothetical protein
LLTVHFKTNSFEQTGAELCKTDYFLQTQTILMSIQQVIVARPSCGSLPGFGTKQKLLHSSIYLHQVLLFIIFF